MIILNRIKLIGSFQFWMALLFSTLFFFPFIKDGFGEKAGFLFLGDVINLWIPQIYKTYLLNQSLTFDGIDFSTQGGSSEYFLRPNLFTHSPIIFIASFILKIDSLKTYNPHESSYFT